MLTFKGYVSNKARPEGCIAASYLKEEAITYCKSYRRDGEAVFPQPLEEKFDGSNQTQPSSCDVDEYEGDVEGAIGLGERIIISGTEYEQARTWVIKSHPSYETWERYILDRCLL